jgi:hypothetical protein
MNDCKCQKIDVIFEDNSQNYLIDFQDNSEKLNIEMQDSGNTIYHNQAVILTGTTEYWNSKPGLISQKDVFYVYTDYANKRDGSGGTENRPGLKIGDGQAYLIDIPFVTGDKVDITQEDVDKWNNKWRGYILDSSPERLIFTTA